MQHIYLIEDDLKLASLIQQFLLKQRYTVDVFNSIKEYHQHKNTFIPALIICDIMLPDGNGFELIDSLKERHACPVIFLTALDCVQSQIKGLNLGAYDYLIKPIRPELLLAKVRIIIQHTHEQNTLVAGTNNLTLNAKKRDALFYNTPLNLNESEYDIIACLAQYAPKPILRETLFEQVIGREYNGLDRAVDLKISRLRKKLRENTYPSGALIDIKSVRGRGYCLDIIEP